MLRTDQRLDDQRRKTWVTLVVAASKPRARDAARGAIDLSELIGWLSALRHGGMDAGKLLGAKIPFLGALLEKAAPLRLLRAGRRTPGCRCHPERESCRLGAEIGTCADTLVASFGRSRAALRVAVFHLLFNVVAVVLGALCIGWLVAAAAALSPAAGPGRQLANAHTLFNTVSALLALPLLPWAALALRRVLPERGDVRGPAVGAQVVAVSR